MGCASRVVDSVRDIGSMFAQPVAGGHLLGKGNEVLAYRKEALEVGSSYLEGKGVSEVLCLSKASFPVFEELDEESGVNDPSANVDRKSTEVELDEADEFDVVDGGRDSNPFAKFMGGNPFAKFMGGNPFAEFMEGNPFEDFVEESVDPNRGGVRAQNSNSPGVSSGAVPTALVGSALNSTGSNERTDDLRYQVFIDLLNKYCYTKDGRKFGSYNKAHADKLFEHLGDSRFSDLLECSKENNEGEVVSWKVKTFTQEQFAALVDFLRKKHKSSSSLFKLFANSDLPVLGEPKAIIEAAVKSALGRFTYIRQGAERVELKSGVLTNVLNKLLLSTAGDAQAPLEDEDVRRLVKHYSHPAEQQQRAGQDGTWVARNLALDFEAAGILPKFKAMLGLALNKDDVDNSALKFREKVTALGGEVDRLLNEALDKSNAEYSAQKVGQRTVEKINSALRYAHSLFKRQRPDARNVLPEKLSDVNAQLIADVSIKFNGKIRSEIFDRYVEMYMRALTSGVSEHSYQKFNSAGHVNELLPDLVRVHDEYCSMLDAADQQVTGFKGAEHIGSSCYPARRSDLVQALAFKIEDNYGAAFARWSEKLSNIMQIGKHSDRIARLYEKLDHLNNGLNRIFDSKHQDVIDNEKIRTMANEALGPVIDDIKRLERPGFFRTIRIGAGRALKWSAITSIPLFGGLVAASSLPAVFRAPLKGVVNIVAPLMWVGLFFGKIRGAFAERAAEMKNFEEIQKLRESIERQLLKVQVALLSS